MEYSGVVVAFGGLAVPKDGFEDFAGGPVSSSVAGIIIGPTNPAGSAFGTGVQPIGAATARNLRSGRWPT